ncbi:exonuclease domain-containing protein [Flaviflexus huanghaiensis]|uniref:exonuclease domain-containing protein n=1 Tax=Flaviflexus huanghaiensis TaxID=1111473 RepID=UPI0015FBBEEF|nr:exonuclease domain-containing protein [Flaviflexus huanghaiensis]
MVTQPHWSENPLLGFDTETTGVSPLHSRIVTASVIVTGKDATTKNWLINPGVEIPSAAQEVHGISTARARAEGADPLFALAEIRDILIDGMKAGYPVVAFNAAFDLTLLDRELARFGLDTMTDLLGREPFPVLDPLALDRMINPYRKGPRRLETLLVRYGIEASDLHDAENDVLATLKLLHAMKDHAMLRASSLRKLHELQKETQLRWADSLNRYLAASGRKPNAYGHWPIFPRDETTGPDGVAMSGQPAASSDASTLPPSPDLPVQ